MESSGERDEELMQEVVRGRSECLEALVRRHAVGLLTFLTRMVGDRHRAEELFQEVFLTVWLKRLQFDATRSFRAWLYTIAVNHCRAVFRRHVVPAGSLTDSPFQPRCPGESAEDRVCASETAEQVNRAITRLPEQQRAVVVLRIWEGLPYARIADIVGCTEGTVRSHMHHGLAALRQHLQPLVETQA